MHLPQFLPHLRIYEIGCVNTVVITYMLNEDKVAVVLIIPYVKATVVTVVIMLLQDNNQMLFTVVETVVVTRILPENVTSVVVSALIIVR